MKIFTILAAMGRTTVQTIIMLAMSATKVWVIIREHQRIRNSSKTNTTKSLKKQASPLKMENRRIRTTSPSSTKATIRKMARTARTRQNRNNTKHSDTQSVMLTMEHNKQLQDLHKKRYQQSRISRSPRPRMAASCRCRTRIQETKSLGPRCWERAWTNHR